MPYHRPLVHVPPDYTFNDVDQLRSQSTAFVQNPHAYGKKRQPWIKRLLREHHWVHITCRGSQHAMQPADPCFAMRDGRLMLVRVVQERYCARSKSELAFLSVCHTTMSDPHDALYLAAPESDCVIGTLWRVDNSTVLEVVARFYREMFVHANVGFEHAAMALNAAVLKSAEDVQLEARMAFVHTGI